MTKLPQAQLHFFDANGYSIVEDVLEEVDRGVVPDARSAGGAGRYRI